MGKDFHFVKYPIDQNKNYSFTLVKKFHVIEIFLVMTMKLNLKENNKFS